MKSNSAKVAAGILLSRISGLIRTIVIGQVMGAGAAADAFNAGLRIPNLLQNLLGEGVLSASFIPSYAPLVDRDETEAGRLAGAVVTILALIVSTLALIGVLFADKVVVLLAPGFDTSVHDLTVRIVRLLFPATAILVLSAWCLGVLNSHRKFFLSYVAPVIWNLAIIAALVAAARMGYSEDGIAIAAAWGLLAGSVLQFLIQLPTVLRLSRVRLSLGRGVTGFPMVVRNFGPAFVGRGVVQLSGFVDLMIASELMVGSVAILSYAQTLYMLPVSLFGMSVSAAELPELSRLGSGDEDHAMVRTRLEGAAGRIALLVIPSAVALALLGGRAASVIWLGHRFTAEHVVWMQLTLMGSALGLLASTWGRLLSSAFFARNDTRTPLRFAVIRVILTAGLGAGAALWLVPALGLSPYFGTAALTATAGVAGWVEFLLLRHALSRIIGPVTLRTPMLSRIWIAAAAAGGLAWSTGWCADHLVGLRTAGLIACISFAVFYRFAAVAAGVDDPLQPFRRLVRR